jgi:pyruvate,orthophosphate dikinase
MTAEDLKGVVAEYKKIVKEKAGQEFPTDPWEQLWGAICAVFDSWNTPRAIFIVEWSKFLKSGELL